MSSNDLTFLHFNSGHTLSAHAIRAIEPIDAISCQVHIGATEPIILKASAAEVQKLLLKLPGRTA